MKAIFFQHRMTLKNHYTFACIRYDNNQTIFKNQLIEFSQTYFPENFNDFSEGNPGMMFLEMAAYVGDVLSFYTDNQIQENFNYKETNNKFKNFYGFKSL